MQFSNLPLSKELRTALRKLNVRRLGDLGYVARSELRAVSENGAQLLIELDELLHTSRSEPNTARQFGPKPSGGSTPRASARDWLRGGVRRAGSRE
jgi:hypothetical protein